MYSPSGLCNSVVPARAGTRVFAGAWVATGLVQLGLAPAGAGKTTAMSILTAQNLPTGGEVRVFGENPYENARVLSRMCFVRESQKYPDDATPRHAFTSARLFFPRWDQALADDLVDEFEDGLR